MRAFSKGEENKPLLNEDDPQYQCHICCEDFPEEEMVFHKCSHSPDHIFCKQCINDWKLVTKKKKSDMQCPTCRTFMLKWDEIKVFNIADINKESEKVNSEDEEKKIGRIAKDRMERVMLKYYLMGKSENKEFDGTQCWKAPINSSIMIDLNTPVTKSFQTLMGSVPTAVMNSFNDPIYFNDLQPTNIPNPSASASASTSANIDLVYDPNNFAHCYTSSTTYDSQINLINQISRFVRSAYHNPIERIWDIVHQAIGYNLQNLPNDLRKRGTHTYALNKDMMEFNTKVDNLTLIYPLISEMIQQTRLGMEIFQGGLEGNLGSTASIASLDNPNFMHNLKNLLDHRIEECPLNEEGKRHGLYKLYLYQHPDKLFYTANYQDGVKEGMATYYHANGSVAMELTYCYGILEGALRIYYPSENTNAYFRSKYGLLALDTYIATDLSSSSSSSSSLTYVLGDFTLYKKDGTVHIKQTMVMDSNRKRRVDGPFQYPIYKKLERGCLMETASFKGRDYNNGEFDVWPMIVKGTCKNDLLDGKVEFYLDPSMEKENGKKLDSKRLYMTCHYKDGIKEGPCTKYYFKAPGVKVLQKCVYKDDEIVLNDYHEYHLNQSEKVSIQDGIFKAYSKAGDLQLEFGIVRDSTLGKYHLNDHMTIYYDTEGAKGTEGASKRMLDLRFKNGTVTGELKIHCENGDLFFLANTEKNRLNGLTEEYYLSGNTHIIPYVKHNIPPPLDYVKQFLTSMMRRDMIHYNAKQSVEQMLHPEKLLMFADNKQANPENSTEKLVEIKKESKRISEDHYDSVLIHSLYETMVTEWKDYVTRLWKEHKLASSGSSSQSTKPSPEPYLYKRMHFMQNELHGKYQEYAYGMDGTNEDFKIKADIDYEYGLYHGKYREYRDPSSIHPLPSSDRLMEETEYSTHYNNGVSRKYHPNGQISHHAEYQSNTLHGHYLRFHPDGTPAEDCYYQNGVLSGMCKTFNEDGTILGMIPFENGRMHGEVISYYSYKENQPSCKENYTNGVRDGPMISYYRNGNVMRRCEIKRGRYHGTYETFYEGGQPEFIIEFVEGILQKATLQHYKVDGTSIKIDLREYYMTVTHIVGGRVDASNAFLAYGVA